jgi:hypothetical protein
MEHMTDKEIMPSPSTGVQAPTAKLEAIVPSHIKAGNFISGPRDQRNLKS